MSFLFFLSVALLASLAAGGPVPDPALPLASRQVTITPGGKPCGQNNETNRRCWKNQWSVDMDYDKDVPPAFNTREYNFYITNVTNWVGPDGVVKDAMLINGQFPGPTIEADWGDYIYVHVHNELQDNGTSIHWHGIRQVGEAIEDGANGVTECPIPPGKSKSYAFHVRQYGTSWYHSHFSSQYGNGIAGALVVNGPATADYDIDLGPFVLTDYYYETADNLHRRAELSGPPDSNNVLIRGKNVHPSGNGGEYDRVTLTPGKKHRVRLINTSVDNSFTVSLVGHTFTAIQMDLVPIQPKQFDHIFLGVGQRYDVIVEANRDIANYWFNITLEKDNNCGRSLNLFPASIFHYEGAPEDALPTDQGQHFESGCADEVGMVPWVRQVVPRDEFQPGELNLTVAQPAVDFRGAVFRWLINNLDITIEWDHPILEYVFEGRDDWPAEAQVFDVPEANRWTFWILQNQFILPHPIHLHGHDFLILGTGSGRFDPALHMDQLQFDNPTRRDVAQMPGSGWIVMAFLTDNPGAWLLHCHIAWHVGQGLGITFLERKAEIPQLMHLDQMYPTCDEWRDYWPTAAWRPMLDSGL